jgi:hypothetical protein
MVFPRQIEDDVLPSALERLRRLARESAPDPAPARE